MPKPILLTGSLSLADETEVFQAVSTLAGPCVRRIPDGETGARGMWIGWQAKSFASNPALVRAAAPPPATGDRPKEYKPQLRYVLKDGTSADGLLFDDLGYAEKADRSYDCFRALRDAGKIAPGTRFQVSLPTPLAILTAFVALEAQPAIEPALEAGMLRELAMIVATIPSSDLAIQWDVAVEFGIMETDLPSHVKNDKAGIVERLVSLGNAVPPGVELGYHLCYGNMGLKHFKEPEDTALLVEISNGLVEGLHRNLDWIHMPVPINRDDEEYFAPLASLRVGPNTQTFLGLIHMEDGVEGAARRMATAQRFLPRFGVASECGLSQRSADWTKDMLKLHKEVAEA